MFRIMSTTAAMLLLASPCLAENYTWKIDPSHTDAQFSVRHMMISNVHGGFNKTSGMAQFDGVNPSSAKVEALIDVSSIDTHESKRDEHLKGADFFDVAKYPTMKFVSKRIEKTSDGKYKMVGDLTLHGVTKEVVLDLEGPFQVVKDPHGNERFGASATTKINRKEFGLSYNGLLETGGVMIGDDVAINVDVEMIKDKAKTSSKSGSKQGKDG